MILSFPKKLLNTTFFELLTQKHRNSESTTYGESESQNIDSFCGKFKIWNAFITISMKFRLTVLGVKAWSKMIVSIGLTTYYNGYKSLLGLTNSNL